MNTHDIDIELPEHWKAFKYNEGWGSWEQVRLSDANNPGVIKVYTADQVVAAIEADRKRRGVNSTHALGEPVCTCKTNALGVVHRTDGPCLHYDPQPAEPVDKSKNLQGSVVDKAEEMQGQPAEPRLDTPAQVGHTRFGEGVPWSTVIGAAQRYHAAQNTPAKEQERLQRAAENIKALHQAEPVKVPSDAEILSVAIESGVAFRDSTGDVVCAWREDADISEYLVENARALLARYGNAAQPAQGQEVSIDISTSDHDAGRRAFGELTGEVNAGVWLAEGYVNQPTASADPFGHVWRASDTTAVIKLVGDPRIIDGMPVYAAPVAAQPSVLDGWKLVPEEPTMEMLYAARKADKEYQARMGLPDTIGVGAYDHYVAMLEAAPVVAQPSAEPTSSD